jgi:hypothetical protein
MKRVGLHGYPLVRQAARARPRAEAWALGGMRSQSAVHPSLSCNSCHPFVWCCPSEIPICEQAGEFPVDQQDALFAYNMTKLLLSQIASLTLAR